MLSLLTSVFFFFAINALLFHIFAENVALAIVQLDTRFNLAIQCLTICDTALLYFRFLQNVFTSAYPDTSQESLAGTYFQIFQKPFCH